MPICVPHALWLVKLMIHLHLTQMHLFAWVWSSVAAPTSNTTALLLAACATSSCRRRTWPLTHDTCTRARTSCRLLCLCLAAATRHGITTCSACPPILLSVAVTAGTTGTSCCAAAVTGCRHGLSDLRHFGCPPCLHATLLVGGGGGCGMWMTCVSTPRQRSGCNHWPMRCMRSLGP